MKTNANLKTIKKAVENVSKNYEDNIVLLREPDYPTKNIVRFVVKAKDRNKPGGFVLKNGVKTSKANESVQLDVIDQIFKLENKPNVFVDTHVGRIWKDDRAKQVEKKTAIIKMEEVPEVKAKEASVVQMNPLPSNEELKSHRKPFEKVTKRKYNTMKARERVKELSANTKAGAEKLLKALEYILNHEEIFEKV